MSTYGDGIDKLNKDHNMLITIFLFLVTIERERKSIA